MNISEKDWKLFRKKVPQWQEAYMDRLAREYMAILSGNEKPSEKFWNLYDRINADVNCVGVQIRMSRSRMIQNIISLINEGAITLDDLSDFSNELRENVQDIIVANEAYKEYIANLQQSRAFSELKEELNL